MNPFDASETGEMFTQHRRRVTLNRMITTALMMFVALLALPALGYAQRAVPVPNPGRGPLVHHRYVAVTHLRDYLQQDHLAPIGPTHWRTRTLLFGINGTDRVADVGVYVLGQGQVFLSVFRHIDPGHESFLLPGVHYFGDDNSLSPPAYVGETVVVVSSEPLIVTGAVVRGYSASDRQLPDWAAQSNADGSRTFDVRQYDCTVPAEFVKVAMFCRNLAPVEQN